MKGPCVTPRGPSPRWRTSSGSSRQPGGRRRDRWQRRRKRHRRRFDERSPWQARTWCDGCWDTSSRLYQSNSMCMLNIRSSCFLGELLPQCTAQCTHHCCRGQEKAASAFQAREATLEQQLAELRGEAEATALSAQAREAALTEELQQLQTRVRCVTLLVCEYERVPCSCGSWNRCSWTAKQCLAMRQSRSCGTSCCCRVGCEECRPFICSNEEHTTHSTCFVPLGK